MGASNGNKDEKEEEIMEAKAAEEDHQTEEPTVSESNGSSSLADTAEEKQEGTEGTMKLVIRSPYWGRVLKGKPRRDQYNASRPYRIFQCQAILSQKGRYWGCCPNHGKRVLELKEYHFTECYPHDWDLYMMGSGVTPSNVVHSFFLLPQNQTVVDLNCHLQYDGWTYVGTLSASSLRIDLEGLLYDFLAQNNDYGFNFHHVHVDLLMDQVTDREAESNRLKTQARRAERLQQQQGGNNVGNKNQANTQRGSGPGNPPPAIPHVISNDASFLSAETIRSNMGGGTDSWSESFHPGYGYHRQHPGPGSAAHGWPNPHGAQWVAAASVPNHHMIGPPNSGQPLPPVQQALQSFPMPHHMSPVQQFPLGYVPQVPPYYQQPQYEQGGAPEEWSSSQPAVPLYCVPTSATASNGSAQHIRPPLPPQQQEDSRDP